MNANQVKDMFVFVSEQMILNEKYLTEIDNKIGDGDHGIGMAIGFTAIKEKLEEKEFNSVNQIFYDIGITMLSVMGGASGVLFGTIFISGIVDYPQKQEFELTDFANVFRTSLYALKKRGKAKKGDKTMVDALEPAVEALEDQAKKGADIKSGFSEAKEAACEGMESTKRMKAGFGRAKYYGEKALGIQDAGATSVYIIFASMSSWIENNL